ncbi:MAG TPA: hypothetical protein VGP55_06460 [Chitinophagaceae bacterium]|nr:hypothetical protein [Chitinophagaceae bacterium]
MKKKVAIYPGFGTSTHEPLHQKLIDFAGAVGYSYESLNNFEKNNFLERAKVNVAVWFSFLILNIYKKDRDLVKYKGIKIFHSLIEYSIRMHPLGKFIFNSRETLDLIAKSINYIRCCTRFFKQNNVVLIIGGDEAYIHGSILGQLAVQKNIKHLYIKQFNPYIAGFHFDTKTLYAGPNFKTYPDFYSTLHLDPEIINQYRNEIRDAANGRPNYFFMRNQDTPIPDLTKVEKDFLDDAVVLFLHDFIDSPGIYGSCVFFDQWEWIAESVTILKRYNKRLVIKIHPNVNDSNKVAIQLLKQLYHDDKSILFIEKKTSLIVLKENGIRGVLTLFGSVIVECAFLGIPCISAANNPYIGFEISLNAISKNDFRKKMANLCGGKIQQEPGELKMKSVRAFISHRMFYAANYLVKNLPYDDVDKDLFQEMYAEIPGTVNYGINERRSVFLNSGKLREYVIEKINCEEADLKERFYFLIN